MVQTMPYSHVEIALGHSLCQPARVRGRSNDTLPHPTVIRKDMY